MKTSTMHTWAHVSLTLSFQVQFTCIHIYLLLPSCIVLFLISTAYFIDSLSVFCCILLLQQSNFPTEIHKVSSYLFMIIETRTLQPGCSLFEVYLYLHIHSHVCPSPLSPVLHWSSAAVLIAWVNLLDPGLRLLGIHRFQFTERKHIETSLPPFCQPPPST